MLNHGGCETEEDCWEAHPNVSVMLNHGGCETEEDCWDAHSNVSEIEIDETFKKEQASDHDTACCCSCTFHHARKVIQRD